jgi:predicted short-subunit dehydrogenase-like oxidoreductase (DUF2520 family)
MKAAMLGSGKVATAMGLHLAKNIEFVEVFSPNSNNATTLANKLNADVCSKLEELTSQADVYILAVKDDALEALAQKLRLRNKLVVHTSGSAKMEILNPISNSIGVLYPLQSIPSNFDTNKWSAVNLCIEASDEQSLLTLKEIANLLSPNLHIINSTQRLNLHLAAVFANNFVNHLLHITQNLVCENKVDSALLNTLIRETIENAIQFGAEKCQTGPAIRKDKKTLEKHLQLLDNKPLEKEIYALLSQSIQKDIKHE